MHLPFPTSNFPSFPLLFLLDDGLALAVDNGACVHPVCLSRRFWSSCGGGREARSCWDFKKGVSANPVQAEERLDLELPLCGGGETCPDCLQNWTGILMSSQLKQLDKALPCVSCELAVSNWHRLVFESSNSSWHDCLKKKQMSILYLLFNLMPYGY